MESFVSYRSFHEALKDLSIEEYGRVMYAINEYALNDNELELEGVAKIAFTLIKPQLDANKNRRDNGSKGGRPQKTNGYEDKKPMVIDSAETEKPTVIKNNAEKKPNVNVNVNENVNSNVNENVLTGQKPDAHAPKNLFVKPSISQIKDYCKERNNGIDAERFFDYYESKGWLVGKSPMKDWKAAVRNWENRTTSQDNSYGYGQAVSKTLPPDRLTL